MTGTNTGLEFWNNTIGNANGLGIGGPTYSDRQHNSIIIGNTFPASGAPMVGVGLRGNNNLLAYNEFAGPKPDAFVIDGTYSFWLNNYIHGASDASGHSDAFQAGSSSLGLQYNLYESNFILGTGNLGDEHGVLMRNASDVSCDTLRCAAMNENLFRRNVWHNISGGHLGVGPSAVDVITNTRQVHETVVRTQANASTATSASSYDGTGSTAWLFNNLNYQAWGSGVTSNVRVFLAQGGATIRGADYNLAYDPDGSVTFTTPWTSQTKELSNVDPALTNVGTDDFTIGSGSGARNAGGPLTVTSGSGTGTTFNVGVWWRGVLRGPNTNITQYDGNLTAGDVITVGTTTRTVASVSGDAITVTSSFTWALAIRYTSGRARHRTSAPIPISPAGTV